MVNKALVYLFHHTDPLHVRVCRSTGSCPEASAEFYHRPRVLFSGHTKPNTHAGQRAHLHTTTSLDTIILSSYDSVSFSLGHTHTHTLSYPLVIPTDVRHYTIIITKPCFSIGLCFLTSYVDHNFKSNVFDSWQGKKQELCKPHELTGF